MEVRWSCACPFTVAVVRAVNKMAMKDVFNSRVRSAIYPPSARKKVRAVHREIAQLVLDGKAEKAEEVMRIHLEEFAAYAVRRLPGLLDDTVSWQ